MRILKVLLLLVSIAVVSTPAFAQAVGNISAITMSTSYPNVPDGVFIKLNSGLPSNCAGTTNGWMWIPATSTVLTAYVEGLWLSGAAPSVSVTVFTLGLETDGYCEVAQIEPAS